MRVPVETYAERPWRIHALTADFRVEDVWALPTPGRPEDFPRLVQLVAGEAPGAGGSLVVRALFAVRWVLGAALGLDADTGQTLRDRLPPDLAATTAATPAPAPFRPLYVTGDEWAVELANRTVHGILHLAWVGDHAEMAVLVKRNGLLGAAYMAAITPFRHTLVYPAMLDALGRRWAGAGA